MIIKDQFAGSKCRIAKVLEVDGSTCTVETLDTETEISDVRLQAQQGNGIYLKPSIDSFVIIAPIDDFEYVVVMYSDVDEITFLDGSFGGLIKIADLITKLNNLENKVNSLISYINGHVHAGTGVPPAPLFLGGNLTPTVQADIENPKITHGDV